MAACNIPNGARISTGDGSRLVTIGGVGCELDVGHIGDTHHAYGLRYANTAYLKLHRANQAIAMAERDKTGKDMATKDKSKATLIVEWNQGVGAIEDQYRLISTGKWTAGYEDEYVVEVLGTDALGHPVWRTHLKFDPKTSDIGRLLVGALKSTLKPSGS